MFAAANALRVTENPGSAVRRGAQPDDMRSVADRVIVRVFGFVMQGDVDGHDYECKITATGFAPSALQARGSSTQKMFRKCPQQPDSCWFAGHRGIRAARH